ncbi:MAG: hypothetical protein BLITH_0196 [Brockia lithotrophica]|uniref:Flavin reductase like domain-containing protein n=1 Tax=Brockia lithotrophica TaxID=933949 RepID=A0A2T5GAA0_9BACL|nr:MAG: hypothetical protein BLITH_0196 [Brockia lithotrophica]
MDPKARKTALRGIVYGLYVVGTKGEHGPNAFAANWLTQVSFEPPRVALAAKKGSRSEEEIATSGVFSVNFLPAGAKEFAQTFFGPVREEEGKLGGYAFRPGITSCPIFDDAVSYIECRVVERVDVGDHVLYVGEVVDAGVHREGVETLTLRETGFFYGG